jgi:hypothetical protein
MKTLGRTLTLDLREKTFGGWLWCKVTASKALGLAGTDGSVS